MTVDPRLYQYFVTTVAHGSITAAAAELGVSRPTLSRHLSTLEKALGLALLHRTTRHVRPTPAGRRLHERIVPLFGDLAAVESDLMAERDDVSGLLRVSAPPLLARPMSRLLVTLQQQHRSLTVELLTDIQQAELQSDNVEVAVRAGRSQVPNLIQRRLLSRRVGAVASPEYLARRSIPRSVEELEGHTLLRGHGMDGRPRDTWPLRGGGRVAVHGPFVSNDQRALLEAALAHGGIAMLTDVNTGRALEAGRLVPVLPQQLGTRIDLHVVFAHRTLQPARVRVFTEALVQWSASDLRRTIW